MGLGVVNGIYSC